MYSYYLSELKKWLNIVIIFIYISYIFSFILFSEKFWAIICIILFYYWIITFIYYFLNYSHYFFIIIFFLFFGIFNVWISLFFNFISFLIFLFYHYKIHEIEVRQNNWTFNWMQLNKCQLILNEFDNNYNMNNLDLK